MIYEFMTDDGRIVEQVMPASQAPDIGQVCDVGLPDGSTVKATRIISTPAAVAGDHWKPYVSMRLPRNLPGVPCTPSGKPIISTRAQERNIMARYGYERE